MGAVHSVTVADATLDDKPVIANLMQLCLHDFSEFAVVGTEFGDITSHGLFTYDWLDPYWLEADRFAFTILADGRLAGFALINRWSALDRPIEQSMAEFFVLRKYRRAGVGARAAGLLFDRFSGRWEVPVAWYNQPALAFWRRAVAGPVEECAGDGERWSGTVLCLTRANAA